MTLTRDAGKQYAANATSRNDVITKKLPQRTVERIGEGVLTSLQLLVSPATTFH